MKDEEDQYDTPWEYLARPASIRLSSADVRVHAFNAAANGSGPSPSTPPSPANNSPRVPHHNGASCQQFAHNHSLVHIGNTAVEARRHQRRDCQNKERRQRRMDERQILDELLLERNVDRVNAEKRLAGGQLGDYLLRARGENSAALSLKGTKGILHIKIEKRDNKWIIGEGPSFGSISSAIHHYKRHPLPIRGSDHLILHNSVTQAIRI
ncbi:hypothetical protein WR25_20765 [Diploscapter pachys]|uniref:SH2 domain-containing protein n=1 Tax=Diploscapter pachys TaxID=2018661 RepID=A0A2A2KE22_9BILA|nr:hypothetical protein WR25_20765 [Diploscapter pachys]